MPTNPADFSRRVLPYDVVVTPRAYLGDIVKVGRSHRRQTIRSCPTPD